MSATRRRRAPHARSGFTLIEVVLAMGIFLIGAAAILGFLTFGAALAQTAGLRTLSAEAIEAVVADLEENLFTLDEDGRVGEARELLDRPVPGYPELVYSVRTAEDESAEPETSASPEVRVDVEIKWKGGAARRGRRVSVLLLKEVPFGERLRRQLVAPRESESSSPADTSEPETRP